jgi:hypothetical protein
MGVAPHDCYDKLFPDAAAGGEGMSKSLTLGDLLLVPPASFQVPVPACLSVCVFEPCMTHFLQVLGLVASGQQQQQRIHVPESTIELVRPAARIPRQSVHRAFRCSRP